MPFLLLKELPRYECLLKASEQYETLDPSALQAFLHLLRTGDDVSSAEGEFLGRHHVSQSRFMVLSLLHHACEKAYSPAELADASRVSRATMTGLIDTLEKDGLVVRETDPRDRRTIHVRLTPAGTASVEEILPEYFKQVCAILKPLNETERTEFVRLLGKIQEGLTQSGVTPISQPVSV